MNRKAISLLSGGLDSILATRLIKEQDIEVIALHFTSLFCTCTKGDKSCGIQALRSAKELDVEVMVKVKGMEYLDIVRHPRHGYGRNLNPCIDCRIYMLREARKVMDEVGASFLITGEVLGQRPMSQHREAIRVIDKDSGLEGLIVRPLSAKFFEPTLPEIEGIIDRTKLLGFSGRSRRPQYDLAQAFDLKEFSCPGGGCLLTDSNFARKLKDLFSCGEAFTMRDVALLKIGRHFRLTKDAKLILGRDQDECERLAAAHTPPHTLLTPFGFTGPTGLLTGVPDKGLLETAGNLMALYGKEESFPVTVEYCNDGTPVPLLVEKNGVDRESLII
jgi:tRNA-specific 2-thiouridylase